MATEAIESDGAVFDEDNFASIAAISGDKANSSNPWVQASRSLTEIQKSSRSLIKAEEKRQKNLREAWKEEMDKKAALYPQKARDQAWWVGGASLNLAATMTAPFLAAGAAGGIASCFQKLSERETIANLSSKLAGMTQQVYANDLFKSDFIVSFFKNLDQDAIKNALGSQWSTASSGLIQQGSQKSQLNYADDEQLLEWSSQKERQDLETQQQIMQEVRQADTSLKERHLEVIKTLTSQVTGH